LILLMLLGLIRHRWLILSLLLVACLYRFREAMLTDFSASNPGSVAPNALVLEFIAGICFYLYKDRIRLNPVLFVICLALAVALHADGSWVYLGVLPAAYVTIYLGMQTPRKPPFIFDGDYSYGVYLYAFPVQQMLVYLYPGLREWWINFMLSFPIVLACSYCSWHLIEKHALKLKQQARPTALLPAIELTLMARVKAMMPVFR
jgi:peptidoglycan/LPS O-acetylase OafA/YrhL